MSKQPLTLCGLAFIVLFSSAVANAAGGSCADLFAQTSLLSNTGELNEPSREFLTRLNYLINERRLLKDEVLRRLADASQPINPLSDGPSSVTLLPHQEAFATLLKEDLQWEEIRRIAAMMSNSLHQEKQREQVAVSETERVVMAVPVFTFDVPLHKTVLTKQGQMLGVNFDQPMGATLTISAYDLLSRKEVSHTAYNGIGDYTKMEVLPYRDTAIASVPLGNSRVLSVDLVAQKPLSATMAANSKISQTHLFEFGGEPRIVAFADYQVLVIDPIMASVTVERVENPVSAETVFSSGVVGKTLYWNAVNGAVYFFELGSNAPIKSKEKTAILSAFAHDQKAYGLTISRLSGPITQKTMSVTVMDLSSGQESPAFKLTFDRQRQARLIDQFEKDGVVYGIISTDADCYVVDLFKGEIKQQLSKTQTGTGLVSGFTALKGEHAVFQFKGKFYLPALRRGGDQWTPSQVVILDAMTLEVVNAGSPNAKQVATIEVVPASGEDQFAVVTYIGGTSSLTSLVSKLNQ